MAKRAKNKCEAEELERELIFVTSCVYILRDAGRFASMFTPTSMHI